jgi:hypothetical protein
MHLWLQETSSAGAGRGKPPRFLNELEALYGDRNQNTGTFMSVCGIGVSTPPHVSMPHKHIGSSSYHSCYKRDCRDQVVNNPQKKNLATWGNTWQGYRTALLRGVHLVKENGPKTTRRWTKQCKSYETTVCQFLQTCTSKH